MRCRLKIAGKSDTGQKRKNNEDYFLVESDLGFMIVADGMGGHAAGEVASKLASTLCTEQLKRSLRTGHVPVFYHVPQNSELDPRSIILGDCVKFSNNAVFEASQRNSKNKNMGTTLVAALWLDDKLAVAHVGDSRLYQFRNNELTQITTDHSFVQEQIDKGLIKPEDAEKSDMKNLLTRSIGIEDDVQVDITEILIQPDDFILLCSDGLTKMLDNSQIATVFNTETDPNTIVSRLIEEANNKGGQDNVTAVVAKVEGNPAHWRTFKDRFKSIFKKKSG